MARTVVLRHDLPDGSHHFDWLIEPADKVNPDPTPSPDDRVLITWRCTDWPPQHSRAAFHIQGNVVRLTPHRRLYLDYEGPISGGRGAVKRVAQGRCTGVTDSPDRFETTLHLDDARYAIVALPASDGRWTIRWTPAET